MCGWEAQWLVYAVVAAVADHVACCNVKEISDIVRRELNIVTPQCSAVGDKCSFDQECCKGLECTMSAYQIGVGLSCQRAWPADPDRGDVDLEVPYPSSEETGSDFGNWFVKGSRKANNGGSQESAEEKSDDPYPTDMLTEIADLQKINKLKLARDNYELEKLFTEKEEKELKQLRALREGEEMDELRRLKERKLKRKMQLIKELKELRGLNEDTKMNTLIESNLATDASREDSITNQTASPYNYSNYLNSSTVSDTRIPSEEPKIEEKLKHKQGIHRKRKHHHHKRTDLRPTSNSTS